ncbi:MAG: tail fiber domain-containing protein [Pseudomonadota bacterium]
MADVILGQDRLELVGGTIVLRSDAGDTIHLAVKDGNLTLGGDAHDGDLMIRDRSGSVTVAINGERGALHLGGPGQDGDITVRNKNFEQTAHLDGRTGDLELKGDVTCQSLTQLSDARLKEGVTPVDSALAAITALTGVRYAFKSSPETLRIGVLAQDVAHAAPEAVRETRAGLAVDQSALVGLLIEAVKSLSREVEKLKAGEARRDG